jgi:hypothetical protein
MFLRRPPDAGERHALSPLTTLRDVVEIVAIVAAGAWAFYTFVYQNDIKPANSPPLVQFEATMTRLGERRGFVAVESHISIKNEGVGDVWFYGIAETILGSTIRPRPRSEPPLLGADVSHTELEPGWIDDPPTAVYSVAIVTQLGNSRSGTTLELGPGKSLPFDRLFYVRAGRYDELQMHIDLRYAAHPKPISFHLATVGNLTELVPSNPAIDTNGDAGTPASLSLW